MSVKNVKFDKLAYKNTTNPMDRWIIIEISKTSQEVIKLMNSYEIAVSVRKIIALIENIRNWYLKFNRDRFKGQCGDVEWIYSTSVLNWVITNFIKLLSPFAPFITEEINISLKKLNETD
jgi:isoleucyl-tRNA synthetase